MHLEGPATDRHDEPQPWEHWYGGPDNELPGYVAGPATLVCTDQTALWLLPVAVWSTGVQLSFELRSRQPREVVEPGHAQLLVGVELSDGTVATNREAHSLPVNEHGPAPRLANNRSSSSGARVAVSYMLNPTPPPGDLIVVTWSGAWGFPEHRHVLTAAALQAARDDITTLWPWQRRHDEPPAPTTAPHPDVPAGGWFDLAIGDV
jgi:hypothetical protein